MMKTMLGAVGLAPAAHVDGLSRQARQAVERATELEDRLAKLRSDVDGWKHRYEEASNAASEWKHAASVATSRADRAAVDTERAQARVEECKARADALAEQ